MLIKVLAINFVAVAGTILVTPFDKLGGQFDEKGFITYVSVIQLLMLSYYGYKVFRERAKSIKHPWQSSITIWAMVSVGFFFLALDDFIAIHEGIDIMIHSIGSFQETGLSDRIDDLIVGLYGLIAIGLLAMYRRELKKYRHAFPYVIAGFTMLFLMVGVDVLTNRDDILLTFLSREVTDNIMGWVFILEESLKLLSEAVLIVAVYSCYQQAKQLTQNSETLRPE